MRVWVTRAQPGADATAERLRRLGHAPLVDSLLDVYPLRPALAEPAPNTAALAFTSANAVRAFAGWSARRDWRVFAVGEATAEVARQAGFLDVTSMDGDVDTLAAGVAAQGIAGLILHPCAREAAGDLAGLLSARGVRLQAVALYETRARAPTADVAERLATGGLDAVLIHSPKAARALTAWLDEPDAPATTGVRVFALSAACLAPLPPDRFASLSAAAEPREAALLALLR